MKTSPFDIYKRTTVQTATTQQKPQEPPKGSETIKGVLLNNYIKKQGNITMEKADNFDTISSRLLILEKFDKPKYDNQETKKQGFDYKKALKPVLIAFGLGVAGLAGINLAANKYSKSIAHDARLMRPDDLAKNFNLVEEDQFALFRFLRDPSSPNLMGFVGVVMMSAMTAVGKGLVDGIQKIWTKKQEYDVDYDLQESLIKVETDAFAGKLDVVNTLLSDSTKYFKSVLGDNTKKETSFKNFLSFRGENKENDEEKARKKKNILSVISIIAGVSAFVALSYGMWRKFQNTASNLDEFKIRFSDVKIRADLKSASEIKDKNKAIEAMSDIFKNINASKEKIKDNLKKIPNVTDEEIERVIKDVSNAQSYVKAPEALGGYGEKIQYYCYMNEPRGHFYNWILEPKNKFNKYFFLALSTLTSFGYVANKCIDAIKDVAIDRENTKSELNLRKRLVETEINNFKSKKLAAINPLMENFKYQLEKGKSKEELKELAENILSEIKNGPPYIYS